MDDVVQRAKAGDEAAFQELFRTHREIVTRIVYRVMGPSADVEDVVQKVFIQVYRSLKKFRGESKFTTWLYRLTVNVTRMHLRRARSRPRFTDAELPEERTEGAPVERPDFMAERSRRAQALRRLIDALSPKKRIVLVLHDLEGMPPKQIAEVVEIPVLTVRTRLFYARKELYRAIAEDPELGPQVEAVLGSLPGKPQRTRSQPTNEDRMTPAPTKVQTT